MMLKFDEMKHALGEPVTQRAIGVAGQSAVVARWRHGHALVALRPDGTEHVVLSLSGDQAVTFETRGQRERLRTKVGRISLMPRCEPTVAQIEPADAFHIFLPASLAEMRGCRQTPHVDPSAGAVSLQLRIHVLKIFVAVHRQDPDDELMLEGGVVELAQAIPIDQQYQRPPRSSGGLAPAAKRRLDELIASRIDADYAMPIKLGEMADAARLSMDHFTRVFRQETGMTPLPLHLKATATARDGASDKSHDVDQRYGLHNGILLLLTLSPLSGDTLELPRHRSAMPSAIEGFVPCQDCWILFLPNVSVRSGSPARSLLTGCGNSPKNEGVSAW